MTYTTNLTVRSYECDSYSHVNNAVYLNYLETARMDYLHQIGFNYKGIVEAGYYLYVTHIDIFYKNSAFLDDKLIIETTPVKLGAVSGTFHQTIKKECACPPAKRIYRGRTSPVKFILTQSQLKPLSPDLALPMKFQDFLLL